MNKSIILHEYHSEDCAEIMKLFYDTIHSTNAADHNENQLDAWVPTHQSQPDPFLKIEDMLS